MNEPSDVANQMDVWMHGVMDDLTAMTGLSAQTIYLVAAAFALLLLVLGLLARRARKREERAEREALVAYHAQREEEAKAKLAGIVDEAVEKIWGRRTLYKRYLAQRELDRYYGKISADDLDPTYEEWAMRHGFDDVAAVEISA